MRFRFRLILLPFIFGTHLATAQGLISGFMQGDRKASLAVLGSQATYDTYYIGTTETRNPNLGTVTTQTGTVLGTYGLSYDLDLLVAASYVRTEASAGYSPRQEGLQDAMAALRWEAFDYKIGPAKLSWQFSVAYSMPMQPYVNDALVAIGRGSKNLEGRTALHLKGRHYFLTGQYGYIRRGQVSLDRLVNFYDPNQVNPYQGQKVNVPDNFELIIRGGIVGKRYNLEGWLQKQTNATQGTNIGPGIPFPTNVTAFTRVGTTLYVRLFGLVGITGGYSTTLDGRNLGKTSQINAGLILGYWTNNR